MKVDRARGVDLEARGVCGVAAGAGDRKGREGASPIGANLSEIQRETL
jgi:hypothetical protein